MAKGICQGFTQGFSRNFKFLLSRKADNLATDGKMFEEECHTSIQKGEEVAVGTLVVNELILIRTVETSHSKQELGKLAGVMQEQGGSSVLQFAIRSREFQFLNEALRCFQ